MKRFKTLKILTLASGRLQLSNAQAKPRLHNLKQIDGDIYEIIAPVQFKAGEEIGYDGEINKMLMLDVADCPPMSISVDVPSHAAKGDTKVKGKEDVSPIKTSGDRSAGGLNRGKAK